MVRHTVSVVRYRDYDLFIGAYPNDRATCAVAADLVQTFRNVHVAMCPHPGPTSKADCLNWIYRAMNKYEEEHSVYFDTVLLHDAEDMIHPEALAIISSERTRNAMVQIPVLPLRTPVYEFTHGCYCDDFAECQSVDMRARQFSSSFIPSCGVGTGIARHILQNLAEERNGVVFDPASLTEDYEIGVYVFNAGFRQRYVPLKSEAFGFSATREYFPRTMRAAIRQRTRWVTGIALQSWARDGWRGSLIVRYWFWRDRKGLFANPLSLLTNLLFLTGLADWIVARLQHRPWLFGVANPTLIRLCLLSSALQCVRLATRMYFTGRVYGPCMAAGVPLRHLHGNVINACASVNALFRFGCARLRKRHLQWLKTDHSYPHASSLVRKARNLTDVLVSEGYVPEEALGRLKEEMRTDEFLADLLLRRGLISEDKLLHAVSLKCAVPVVSIAPSECRTGATRTLPLSVSRRFGIIPYRVKDGRLLVAGASVPEGNWEIELASWTQLPIEFQLVTRGTFEQLSRLADS